MWPSPACWVFLPCRPLRSFSHALLGDLTHGSVHGGGGGGGRGRGLLYQRSSQRLDLLAQQIRAATLEFLLRWPAFPAASATLANIDGTQEGAQESTVPPPDFSTSCAGDRQQLPERSMMKAGIGAGHVHFLLSVFFFVYLVTLKVVEGIFNRNCHPSAALRSPGGLQSSPTSAGRLAGMLAVTEKRRGARRESHHRLRCRSRYGESSGSILHFRQHAAA